MSLRSTVLSTVLLGESYFAERTFKQTVEILKRRGKGLETQIDGLKAVMQDLKAEISFFNDTAAHIAEGVVEIREDYNDEASKEDISTMGVSKPEFNISEGNGTKAAAAAAAVEEYDRLFARMDELEKEELEAEADAEAGNGSESEKDDETSINDHLCKPPLKQVLLTSEKERSKAEQASRKKSIKAQSITHQSDFESTKAHPVNQESDLYSHDKTQSSSRFKTEKNVEFPKSNENVNGKLQPASTNEVPVTTPVSCRSSTTAFTGSIVERNINMNPMEQRFGSTSKPVSRFKQQRR